MSNEIMMLKKWIDDVIENKLWEKFVDLHIDSIYPDISEADWVDSSINLLKLLKTNIDGSSYNCFVSISLSCEESQTTLSEITFEYLSENLDLTPPSLHLFPINNINYNKTIHRAIELEELGKEKGLSIFFYEENDCGEFYRTVYILLNH